MIKSDKWEIQIWSEGELRDDQSLNSMTLLLNSVEERSKFGLKLINTGKSNGVDHEGLNV